MYRLRATRINSLVQSLMKTSVVNNMTKCNLFSWQNFRANQSGSYSNYLKGFSVSQRRFQLVIDRARTGGQRNGQKLFFPVASASMLSFLGFFQKTDEEKEDELILTIKRSVLCIQRGELQKAEKMLHIALRLAQQQQDADGITYVYDLLANLALEKGEFSKSEKLFVSVMQRLLGAGVAQDDNKIIHISLKLAEIYALQADKPEYHTKAKEGFRFSIEALEKKMTAGDKDQDTILLLSLATEGEGKMLAQQGNFSTAKVFIQRALDLSIQSGEDSEERQASLSSDLGALCSMNGDQEAALTHLQNAVDVGRKANAENLPAFLVNLGLLSLYKGMKSEASQACTEAWKISRTRKNKETEKEAVLCLEEIKKV